MRPVSACLSTAMIWLSAKRDVFMEISSGKVTREFHFCRQLMGGGIIHQADLQAEVAARNLLRGLRGEPAGERFLAELVCIVDSLDRGMLVTRRGDRGLALPPLRVMHWAKSMFEKRYLRRYR
jgi:hypothetical protein